ncbi:MAG: GxxExxY protein [Ignavibacteria bacterium]|nr:GxxExxY protein [Ignavibacteria bacterium]MBK9404886.1 GxxExxY protein [Ignavibacteria bacterium]MBL0107043.1 GxxExxY protein [Ignavibacteria bacterium]
MGEKYYPTTNEENLIKEIVDCAFKVHSKLGPGLLERIYEVCFCHELRKKNIKFINQVKIPIKYDDLTFDEGYRIDVLVENSIVCELKAVVEHNAVFDAQILSQLKLAQKHLGLLINFNVPLIKNGIKRFII